MKVKELIEHLKGYPKDMHIAYSLWQPDDVLQIAKRDGYVLTVDEVDAVLDSAERKKDANEGINWITIEYYIQEVISKREG